MTRYSADELFQMAESVEQDGMRFYRAAADRMAEPRLKSLLAELAEWEGRHRERFAALRHELPPEARQDDGPGDPVEEHAEDYLRAYVEGRIFPAARPDLASPEEVLAFAIGREKDTIVFFLTVQAQVPKFRGRDRIQAIVEEELKHVHILERERRRVREGKA